MERPTNGNHLIGENVERDLDALDLQLLRTMLTGELDPMNIALQRRLDRLELEGYVTSSRKDPTERNAYGALVYSLTEKGRSTFTPRKVG